MEVTSTVDRATQFKDLFEACPYVLISKFEQENFNATSGAGLARHIINSINRIRKLESDLELETRRFERKCIEQELDILYSWLESQDPNSIKNSVDGWQSIEREYWINTLGKQAAIELITLGRTSPETMSKMVKLPEDMYIKVTQICVRLANTIKETTVRAEQEIGIVAPAPEDSAEQTPDPAPTGPKKINLKKVK